MKERPFGVSVLAVLAFISGIIGTIGGFSLFQQFNRLASNGQISPLSSLATLVIILLITGVGITSFIFSVGAWNMKPWARPLGIILYVVSIVSNATQLCSGARL